MNQGTKQLRLLWDVSAVAIDFSLGDSHPIHALSGPEASVTPVLSDGQRCVSVINLHIETHGACGLKL